MILELTYARGMRLWLDGKKSSQKGWSYGEDIEDPKIIEFGDGDGIKIGKDTLLRLRTDVPLNEGVPTKVFLTFKNRPPLALNVVRAESGDPDDETRNPVRVTLSNGKKIKVDEITLFLRAMS